MQGNSAGSRGTEDVLRSHLEYRKEGDLEGDLHTNYADDVILLSAEGVHHGHEGVRYLAQILRTYVPDGAYKYHHLFTEADIGLLTWTGSSEELNIHDGADSFVVKNGLITAQTIHYSTTESGG